jgi:hypothetical protein
MQRNTPLVGTTVCPITRAGWGKPEQVLSVDGERFQTNLGNYSVYGKGDHWDFCSSAVGGRRSRKSRKSRKTRKSRKN